MLVLAYRTRLQPEGWKLKINLRWNLESFTNIFSLVIKGEKKENWNASNTKKAWTQVQEKDPLSNSRVNEKNSEQQWVPHLLLTGPRVCRSSLLPTNATKILTGINRHIFFLFLFLFFFRKLNHVQVPTWQGKKNVFTERKRNLGRL